MRSAHRAEVGHLGIFSGERSIVKGTGSLRVQSQVELIFPAKFEAGLRESVVASLSARMPFSQIGSMSRYLVSDDAFLDVITIGQSQVFLGGDVAKHGGSEPANHGSTYGAGDVVVAWRNVGSEWSQSVERSLTTDLKLPGHVYLDQVHGDVSWALDHRLNVVFPGNPGQIAQG